MTDDKRRPTHRVMWHDEYGFFGLRKIEPDDGYDEDGLPVWSKRDRATLEAEADRLGLAIKTMGTPPDLMEVRFEPKVGFIETGLEALTDDPAICPDGTYAAFPPFR